MFHDDQPIIQAYGAASPDHTYKVLEFVIATANRKFAMVPRVLQTGHGFSQAQRTSLDFLYAGRHMVYASIQAKQHDPIELMTYLVSLPHLGVAKAGFAAQLLTGTVGCMDVWNMKDAHLMRVLDIQDVSLFPKQIMRIDSQTSDKAIFSKLFQYCGFCAKVGSAFLWDNWCATLAAQYSPTNMLYPWRTAQNVSTFHLQCLDLA